MPATAAVLEEVRDLEQQMGIEELVGASCANLRFVTAQDGKITEDLSRRS